ncbi:MAG: DUF2905 domain-containing protein [Armatimonadota bacterium]|nr:DUF2905 domain-containing protein [Armatimonadota bacterium]
MLEQLGRLLAGLGALILILGAVMILVGRFAPSGRLLPGDIVIRRPGFTLYFPLMTMIVVSLVLSGIMWLVMYLRR